MKWETVTGSQPERPEEVEMTPTAAYMRKNIRQTESTGADGSASKLWEYEEAKVTPAEYAEMQSPANAELRERVDALDGMLAAVMLGQAEMQTAQDEALSGILLDQMGGSI